MRISGHPSHTSMSTSWCFNQDSPGRNPIALIRTMDLDVGYVGDWRPLVLTAGPPDIQALKGMIVTSLRFLKVNMPPDTLGSMSADLNVLGLCRHKTRYKKLLNGKSGYAS